MSANNEIIKNSESSNKSTSAAELNEGCKSSKSNEETEKSDENIKPNYTNPIPGTAQVQFNKNRKIIIRNVPPVTYEVNVLCIMAHIIDATSVVYGHSA